MLSTSEIILYGAWVLILLPIALISLYRGPQQAEKTIFAAYYRAQPRLNLFGNLFLLTLCWRAMAKLGQHFGVLSAERAVSVLGWIDAAFLVLLLIVLCLMVMAVFKVWRTRRAPKGG